MGATVRGSEAAAVREAERLADATGRACYVVGVVERQPAPPGLGGHVARAGFVVLTRRPVSSSGYRVVLPSDGSVATGAGAVGRCDRLGGRLARIDPGEYEPGPPEACPAVEGVPGAGCLCGWCRGVPVLVVGRWRELGREAEREAERERRADGWRGREQWQG